MFSSLIGLAGFLLPRTRCCHGFGWGCAAVFASSICLGCQLGGKCCDSTHFLTGGWHPSCCHSSVSTLARINTIPAISSSGAQQHDSKEDCCLGLGMLRQFEGEMMLGELIRFARLLPKDPGAGLRLGEQAILSSKKNKVTHIRKVLNQLKFHN